MLTQATKGVSVDRRETTFNWILDSPTPRDLDNKEETSRAVGGDQGPRHPARRGKKGSQRASRCSCVQWGTLTLECWVQPLRCQWGQTDSSDGETLVETLLGIDENLKLSREAVGRKQSKEVQLECVVKESEEREREKSETGRSWVGCWTEVRDCVCRCRLGLRWEHGQ